MPLRECEKLEEVVLYDSGVAGLSMRRLNISSCINLKTLKIFDAPNLVDINITECSNLEVFDLQKVSSIKSVDVSSFPLLDYIWCLWCPNLETIKMAESGYRYLYAFAIIDTAVKSVDLSKCPKIGNAAFTACPNLEYVDMSGCSLLRTTSTFYAPTSSGSPKAEVRLPLHHAPGVLFGLEDNAFGKDEASWCKKVFVANESVKEMVIETGYPKERIEIY